MSPSLKHFVTMFNITLGLLLLLKLRPFSGTVEHTLLHCCLCMPIIETAKELTKEKRKSAGKNVATFLKI